MKKKVIPNIILLDKELNNQCTGFAYSLNNDMKYFVHDYVFQLDSALALSLIHNTPVYIAITFKTIL